MSHLTGNERDQIAKMLAENKSIRENRKGGGEVPVVGEEGDRQAQGQDAARHRPRRAVEKLTQKML